MIKTDGIILDIDGTLWDSTGLVAKAYKKSFRAHSIDEERVSPDILKGLSNKDALEIKIHRIIPLKEAQQEMEKAMFEKAMELSPNKSIAADMLGIHRTTFSRKYNKNAK